MTHERGTSSAAATASDLRSVGAPGFAGGVEWDGYNCIHRERKGQEVVVEHRTKVRGEFRPVEVLEGVDRLAQRAVEKCDRARTVNDDGKLSAVGTARGVQGPAATLADRWCDLFELGGAGGAQPSATVSADDTARREQQIE